MKNHFKHLLKIKNKNKKVGAGSRWGINGAFIELDGTWFPHVATEQATLTFAVKTIFQNGGRWAMLCADWRVHPPIRVHTKDHHRQYHSAATSPITHVFNVNGNPTVQVAYSFWSSSRWFHGPDWWWCSGAVDCAVGYLSPIQNFIENKQIIKAKARFCTLEETKTLPFSKQNFDYLFYY